MAVLRFYDFIVGFVRLNDEKVFNKISTDENSRLVAIFY